LIPWPFASQNLVHHLCSDLSISRTFVFMLCVGHQINFEIATASKPIGWFPYHLLKAIKGQSGSTGSQPKHQVKSHSEI
ncbi:hypothetical protein ACT3R3_16665, partial [Glutamicibacter sp. AOP5-B1-3]